MSLHLKENGFDIVRAKAWADHDFAASCGAAEAGGILADIFKEPVEMPLQKLMVKNLIADALVPAIEEAETAEDIWRAISDFKEICAERNANVVVTTFASAYLVGLQRYCHANVRGYTEHAKEMRDSVAASQNLALYV